MDSEKTNQKQLELILQDYKDKLSLMTGNLDEELVQAKEYMDGLSKTGREMNKYKKHVVFLESQIGAVEKLRQNVDLVPYLTNLNREYTSLEEINLEIETINTRFGMIESALHEIDYNTPIIENMVTVGVNYLTNKKEELTKIARTFPIED